MSDIMRQKEQSKTGWGEMGVGEIRNVKIFSQDSVFCFLI